ncbi:TlpA family protein disulfide reductase [Actinospica robiniae]|uniref:TlpA family protein disulfide reductase n=1 Tax=Actinospica robiniae TaxID=304901 RepID=UPI0004017C89|nr:hypothetical protein [Actinospica robiniae]
MAYLAAAVAVVGALGLLNLLLTLAVIRKLRDHTVRLSAAGNQEGLPAPGTVVSGAQVHDEEGRSIDADWMTRGAKLVVLMSATCSACMEQLPRAAAYVAGFAGAADSVLAVVVGEGGHRDEIVGRLHGLTTLVHGPDAQLMADALGNEGYPTYYVLDEGRVRVATHSVSQLTARTGREAVGAAAAGR